MPNIETLESLSPLADVVTRLKAQEILCLGHNKLYELLRRGELVALKDGPRTLITIESLKRYQANRPRAVFKPLTSLPPAPRRRRRNRTAQVTG